MKKLTLILLMAVLAIPAMQAQFAVTKSEAKRDMTSRNYVAKSTPMQATEWGVRPTVEKMRGTVLYSWDWETEESYAGWGSYDADGDGYGWSSHESDYYAEAYSGDFCLVSDSYLSGGVGALNPENWLISPYITLDGTLSIMAMNYSSWFADNFIVYVCVGELNSLSDFVAISEYCTPGTNWTEYTFDLTQFQGQTGCFAICHCDSYNMYHLYIDDITITKEEIVDVPENLTVDNVNPTTADATWEDNSNAAWNLRYREVVEGIENNVFWGFDESTDGNTNTDLTGGWTSIDSDGDGYGWYVLNDTEDNTYNHHGGIGHATSASYFGGALRPDNWLISPETVLDGTLKLWACGQDPSYAEEVFCVYASTDGQNWEPLTEDITATSVPTQYTFDLTGYEGAMGYIAIRHYHCYDMFRLNIDDIEIVYVEEPEWIYVDNLDATEYTMEGLTPETTYEVQVQGINANGTESDWTESVEFTTPAVQELEKTVAPGIQTWTGTYGDHTQYVKIEEGEPNCEIEYRFKYDNGEWSEWMTYEEILTYTQDGTYEVEARAKAEGKEWSDTVGVRFVITPRTGLDEVDGEKAVAGVRYFNAIGQEMAQPNGLTIVVTTYTDGTTTAVKVMK